MHYQSKVTKTIYITEGENRMRRGYLEGEYGMLAKHRLATAAFYFICYLRNGSFFFCVSLRYEMSGILHLKLDVI